MACVVDGGQLTGCVRQADGYADNTPVGIAVNGLMLYYVGFNGDKAIACDVDGLTVDNCREAGAFNNPHGIALT